MTLIEFLIESIADPFEALPEETVATDKVKRVAQLQHQIDHVLSLLHHIENRMFQLGAVANWQSRDTTKQWYAINQGLYYLPTNSAGVVDQRLRTTANKYVKYHADSVALGQEKWKLEKEIRDQQDAEKESRRTAKLAQRTANWKGTSQAPTGGSIPAIIDTGSSKLDNPYFLEPGVAGYSGDPAQYKFSTPSRRTFETINDALKRNNIPALYHLYGGNYVPQPGRKFTNWIGLAGKGDSVVWYKYDRGGGSGQNYLYICGRKFRTTDLTTLSSTDQDKFLKQYYKL